MEEENHLDLDLRPHAQRFEGSIHDFECVCHANFLTYGQLKAHILAEVKKLKVRINDLRTRSDAADGVTTYKCSCGRNYRNRLRFIKHMIGMRHKPHGSNGTLAERRARKNVGRVEKLRQLAEDSGSFRLVQRNKFPIFKEDTTEQKGVDMKQTIDHGKGAEVEKEIQKGAQAGDVGVGSESEYTEESIEEEFEEEIDCDSDDLRRLYKL